MWVVGADRAVGVDGPVSSVTIEVNASTVVNGWPVSWAISHATGYLGKLFRRVVVYRGS